GRLTFRESTNLRSCNCAPRLPGRCTRIGQKCQMRRPVRCVKVRVLRLAPKLHLPIRTHMTAPHPEIHEAVAPGDLKALAAANGPCLTALVPFPDPTHIGIQIKNAIRGLQKKLVEQATDRKTVSTLLQPVFDLALTARTEGISAHALILFRSPGLFQYYLLHGQFREAQTVDNRFHVRPLLRTLAHETRFHLLGLSQRHVRLWHCTQHRAEPAATHVFPTNLHAWLNNHQSVGGISTDRERQDEYLRHFFKEVDKGVTAHLHSETGPLLLAGVEHEI